MASSPRTRIRTIALAVTIAVAATGLAVIAASGASAATGCQVTYRLNQWTGGFVATVQVRAGSSAITGWTVNLTLPAGSAVTNTWSTQAAGSSGAVSFTNVGYNGNVAAGAQTEFGFQGTGTGPSGTPPCTAR